MIYIYIYHSQMLDPSLLCAVPYLHTSADTTDMGMARGGRKYFQTEKKPLHSPRNLINFIKHLSIFEEKQVKTGVPLLLDCPKSEES